MIDQSKTALIVIDMQKGIFQKTIKVFRERELIENTNSLIDAFHNASMKIFFIRHTNKNILVENSEDWQLHPDLHLQANDIFLNKENSNVFKEKTLKNELDKAGITHIVVTGLVTHGCVKAACQDGKKLGFDVTLAADAHSSYNKEAESLIVEWNKKLAEDGINVFNTNALLRQI